MINSKLAAALLEKWTPVLEATDHIDREETRLNTAIVLENTERKMLHKPTLMAVNEAYDIGGMGVGVAGMPGLNGPVANTGVLGMHDNYEALTGHKGIDGTQNNVLPTMLIPMVRRIFPELMAQETVSVQPMTGPIGFAFAYRALYGDRGQIDGQFKTPTGEIKGTTENELGWNNMYANFSGASADPLDANDPSCAKDDAKSAWEQYTGSKTGLYGVGATTLDGEWAGVGNDNPQFPQVKFNLLHKEVVARQRKLSAHWSLDVQEDANAMQGIDISEEMMAGIGYELAAEIDRQILSSQVWAAIKGGNIASWDPASADGYDQMSRLQTLITDINYYANKIAENTRRGAANFAIASTKATSLIQRFQTTPFQANEHGKIPSLPNTGVGSLLKVGMINNGNQLLIRDTFAGGDYLLLGFKGTQKGDTGVIFCPYIPVQMLKAVDPHTFSPILGARTRYGVLDNVWGSGNYYYFMALKNLGGTVPGIHSDNKHFTFFG